MLWETIFRERQIFVGGQLVADKVGCPQHGEKQMEERKVNSSVVEWRCKVVGCGYRTFVERP